MVVPSRLVKRACFHWSASKSSNMTRMATDGLQPAATAKDLSLGPKMSHWPLLDKEKLLYKKGQEIFVRAHWPSRPFSRYDNEFNVCSMNQDAAEEYRRERDALSPLERSIKYPPLPGLGIGHPKFRMRVLEEVQAGVGHSAQLLRVSVEGALSGQRLLAKIFDPLLDADLDNHWHETDNDPFIHADFGYLNECEAYQKLHHLQGSTVPKFYGSYTFATPIVTQVERDMRMILLEFIDGISLDRLDPPSLSQRTRQNILRQVIITESIVHHAEGIDQNDCAPRNFMARCSKAASLADPNLQVVLVDFAFAKFAQSSEPRARLPTSPLMRWNDECSGPPWSFSDWIDWDWQPWLRDTFLGSADFAPVTPEMRDYWESDADQETPAQRQDEASGSAETT